MAKATLVLGGTGKTGRRVVNGLEARGRLVRVRSRSATPPFDWEDAGTWEPTLAGVDAVYISYYPDLAAAGAVEKIRDLIGAAARQRVERLVLLSGRGEAEAQRCEQLVRESGLPWTILRCSWFSQNFSEGYVLEPILAGEVALPAGDVAEPFVDVDDIAEIAVESLTDAKHLGQLYELTGPRLLTFAQAVDEIARASGRTITYAEVSPEDYKAAMEAQGIPADFVTLVTYLFAEVLDGRNARLADGVQRALGRPPKDFSDYVRDAVAAGAWTT
jgi:uncharacterized protein YbjT (DUF2867 family)